MLIGTERPIRTQVDRRIPVYNLWKKSPRTPYLRSGESVIMSIGKPMQETRTTILATFQTVIDIPHYRRKVQALGANTVTHSGVTREADRIIETICNPDDVTLIKGIAMREGAIALLTLDGEGSETSGKCLTCGRYLDPKGLCASCDGA